MLAKKTSKNQLTLPTEVVKEFPNTDYFDVQVLDRKIVLTPVRIPPETNDLERVRDKMKKLGVTESDLKRAVQWVKRRSG